MSKFIKFVKATSALHEDTRQGDHLSGKPGNVGAFSAVREMSIKCHRKCVLECEKCRQRNFAFYRISFLYCCRWQCF